MRNADISPLWHVAKSVMETNISNNNDMISGCAGVSVQVSDNLFNLNHATRSTEQVGNGITDLMMAIVSSSFGTLEDRNFMSQ